ncbi:NAD(P)H-dependent oxidoreductase [Bdellovibrionota bacterium FG-1]
MKTLVIKYLPSGEKSNTAKLLNIFLHELGNHSVETLDLIEHPAPAFNLESMASYAKRNYGGQTLNPTEAAAIAAQDQLVKQLKSANVVVMAYPMHNFGMPGSVKTYLDAIMQAGETFEMGKKLMAGRKALTIFTSGGLYPTNQATPEYPNWDTLSVLSKINFGFMGFDESEIVTTSLRDMEKTPARMEEARDKFRALIKTWYA